MKAIKPAAFFMSIVLVVFGCKKDSGDDDEDCMNANTTTVTYANTGTVPLRVIVATTLTPQFAPINPILTLDLAPGQSVVKQIPADGYHSVWYTNCAASCSMSSHSFATYAQCQQYEEKRGL